MLYQAYGHKERTKHRIANQTRQVKNFNNYINKQETKDSNNCVGKYKNISEIKKKMSVVG